MRVIGPVSQPWRAIHCPTSVACSGVTFMLVAMPPAMPYPPSSAMTLPRDAATSASSMGATSAPAGFSSDAASFARTDAACFGAFGSICFQSKNGSALWRNSRSALVNRTPRAIQSMLRQNRPSRMLSTHALRRSYRVISRAR